MKKNRNYKLRIFIFDVLDLLRSYTTVLAHLRGEDLYNVRLNDANLRLTANQLLKEINEE